MAELNQAAVSRDFWNSITAQYVDDPEKFEKLRMKALERGVLNPETPEEFAFLEEASKKSSIKRVETFKSGRSPDELPSVFEEPLCGTELRKLLEDLRIDAGWCMTCEQWEEMMNLWGPEVCAQQEHVVERRMMDAEKEQKFSYLEKLRIGWNLAKTVGFFDVTRPHLSIVREAIRRCTLRSRLNSASKLLNLLDTSFRIDAKTTTSP